MPCYKAGLTSRSAPDGATKPMKQMSPHYLAANIERHIRVSHPVERVKCADSRELFDSTDRIVN